MTKKLFLLLALIVSFGLGFALNSTISKSNTTQMKKVTGIGGVFFKCDDPAKMKEWYRTHLGMDSDEYGVLFKWRNDDDSTTVGATQWSPFPASTEYFNPSTKDFMINYIVDDLETLVEELKQADVTILDEIATYSYGKFVHIMDIEGNKIELWQPV